MKLTKRIVVSLCGALVFTLICLWAFMAMTAQNAPRHVLFAPPSMIDLVRIYFPIYLWWASLFGGPIVGFFLTWKYAFRPKKQG
jgi:hypothetical protein